MNSTAQCLYEHTLAASHAQPAHRASVRPHCKTRDLSLSTTCDNNHSPSAELFLDKKLSCRRETARRFVSLHISSHSWSFKLTP